MHKSNQDKLNEIFCKYENESQVHNMLLDGQYGQLYITDTN